MPALTKEQIRRQVHTAEQRLQAISRGELPLRDRPRAERALKTARTKLRKAGS